MELVGFKTTHSHNKVIYHGVQLLTYNSACEGFFRNIKNVFFTRETGDNIKRPIFIEQKNI